MLCDEEDPVCLLFHHTQGSDKLIEISNAVRCGWGEVRLQQELEKCVVLCMNCHAKVHAGVLKCSLVGGSNVKLRF